jgi:hypothetical protein
LARPRNISVWLALALALQVCAEVRAQSLTTYLESSGTEQKPRSNLGLSIRGDKLQLRADVALRASATPGDSLHHGPSGRTEVVPNLRSAFSVAKNLDLETRLSLPEWNAGTDATLDTRLRYRKSLDAFVDELDGSISRSPDGLTKQMLRLGFHQLLGDAGAFTPLAITGAAIFEATQAAAAELREGRKFGIETRVTGLMSPFLTADHSLTFKVEKTVGMRSESASTLAYDQSWTSSSLTRFGFSFKILRRTYSPEDYEPSINFNWRTVL